MARYIYDEIKKELFKGGGSKETTAIIIQHMAKTCREKYNCKVPGEIPEEKLDAYKQDVMKSIVDVVDDFNFYVKVVSKINKSFLKRKSKRGF